MDFHKLRLEIGRLADEVERLADRVEQLARQHGRMAGVAREHNAWTEQGWRDVDPATGEIVSRSARHGHEARKTERTHRFGD